MMKFRAGWAVLIFLGMIAGVRAQVPAEVPPEIPEPAQRYYERLLERPAPGALVDRLCESWGGGLTLAEIAATLEKNAESSEGEDAHARAIIAALVFAKIGNFDSAIRHFDLAIGREPEARPVLLWKARAETARRNLRGALESLDRLLSENPGGTALSPEISLEAVRLRGRLLVRTGRRDKASEEFEKALAASPDDIDLWTDVIELLWEEGMGDSALEKLIALIAKVENRDAYQAAMLRLWLSDLHRTRDETDEALIVLDRVLKATGRDTWLEAEVLDRIEKIYSERDDPAALAAHLEKLAGSGEDRLAVQRRLARLAGQNGDADEARERYREILERTPGRRDVREEFIGFLETEELWEDAVRECARLFAQDTEDIALLPRLARLHHRAGSPGEARKAVQRWLAGGDASPVRILNAANLLEELEMEEEAEATIRSGVAGVGKKDSEDAIELRHALAAFLFRQKKKKTEAIEIWKELASGDSAGQVVRFSGELRRRGESETAFEILNERADELKRAPGYLGSLTEAAAEAERYEDAWKWGLQRVRLATTPAELGEAITRAVNVSRFLDREELIDQLQSERVESPNQQGLTARLLAETGRTRDALVVVRGFRDANPAMSWDLEATIAARNQEWQMAAEAVEALIGLPGQGQKTTLIQQAANYWERAGNQAKALAWIRKWREQTPEVSRIWMREAALLGKMGDGNEALAVLRRAALKFESEPAVQSTFAEACVQSGLHAEAVDAFWRLYARAETLDAKLSWVPRLYQAARSGRLTQSVIAEFQRRRETNRKSLAPLLALARIYREENATDKRRDLLMTASRLEPENISLILELASLEEETGRFDAALQQLARAEETDTTGKLTARIARGHFRLNRMDEAMERVDRLGNSGQISAEEIRGIVEVLLAMGELSRAATLVASAIEWYPKDVPLAYLLGTIRLREERNEEAARAFLKVLSLSQPNPDSFQSAESILSPEAKFSRAMMNRGRIDYESGTRGRVFARPSLAHWMSGSRTNASHPLILNPDAERELHFFALENLDFLMAKARPDVRKAIAAEARMNSHLPEHRVKWMAAGIASTPRGPIAVLEKFPDDAVALELKAVMGFGGDDPATFLRAIEHYRDTRPEIAVLAALTGTMLADDAGGDTRRCFEAVRELAPAIERPDRTHLMRWIQVAQYHLLSDGARSVSPEDRVMLANLGVRWYRQSKYQNPEEQASMFSRVAAILSAEAEQAQFEELVRYELEIGNRARDREDALTLERVFQSQYSGNWLPLFALDRFSPGFLALSLNSGRTRYRSVDLRGGIDRALARMDPDFSDNSIVRFLMAQNRDPTGAEEKLEVMLADPSVGSDRYLVALNYWREVNPNKEKAAEIFSRVLEDLPERNPARWAFVLAAVAFGEEAKQDDLLVKAAEILAKEPMGPMMRYQFESLFKQAGIAFAGAKGRPPSNPYGYRGFQAPPSPGMTSVLAAVRKWIPKQTTGWTAQSIQKLYESGRTDQAVEWALIEMRPSALALLSGASGAVPGTGRRSGNPLVRRAFKDEAFRQALLAKLTKIEVDRGDIRELAVMGALHEFLEGFSAAEEYYASILTDHPGEDEIRLRKLAVMHSLDPDPDAMLAEIRLLEESSLKRLNGFFVDGRSTKDRSRTEQMSLLVAVLERAATDEWVRDHLVNDLASDIQRARNILIQPFQNLSKDRPGPEPEDREICERFFRALLPFPEDHAADSLSTLTALYESEGRALPSDFWTICQKLLKNPNLGFPKEIPWLNNWQPAELKARGFPELAGHLARTFDSEAELRTAIAGWSDQPQHADRIRVFNFFADLYFSEAENYAAILKTILLRPPEAANPYQPAQEWAPLMKAGMRIAEERGLDVDLNEVLVACFERYALSSPDIRVAKSRISQLAADDRIDEALELMASVFTILLEAAENGKESAATPSRMESTRELAFHFLTLFESDQPVIGLTAWNLWNAEKGEKPESLRPPPLKFLTESSLYKNPGMFVQLMDQFGVLAAASEFELTPVPEELRREMRVNHWVTHFINKLRGNRALIPELESIARKKYRKSPGMAMVLAVGKHGLDGQNCRDLMAERLDVFEALPDSEKPAVASYINDRAHTYLSCPELGRWVWQHWRADLETQIEAFFEQERDSKDWEKFDRFLAEAVKHRQFRFALNLLKRWIERESRAVPPGRQTMVVADRLSRLNAAQINYTEDRSWRWWLSGSEAFEFQLIAFTSSELPPFEFDFSLRQWVTRLDPESRRRTPLDPDGRLQGLQQVGRWIEKSPSRVLLIPAAFESLLSNELDREKRAQFVEMAKQSEGDGSWLMHEIAAIGARTPVTRFIRAEDEPIELWEHLKDDLLSLRVRLHLANWYFDRVGFPSQGELKVLPTQMAIWQEVLSQYPKAPIPPELADVANRMAISLRTVGGRDREDFRRIDLPRISAQLGRLLDAQIEDEKRQLLAKMEGGEANLSLSHFWPARIHLFLAEGKSLECLELWEWLRGHQLEYKVAQRRSGDDITSEGNVLEAVAIREFLENGPGGAAKLIERIGKVLEESDDEKAGGKVESLVKGLMYKLPAADRISMITNWMTDPPAGVGPNLEWESLHPFTEVDRSLPGQLPEHDRTPEGFHEFVEALMTKPIGEDAAPLVLGRLFYRNFNGFRNLREETGPWLENGFKPEEIRDSVVLRELKWALAEGVPTLEARHLKALRNPKLPSRFRFRTCLSMWQDYGYRDPRKWPDPADETFIGLAKAGCKALVSEIERGQRYSQIRDFSAPGMVRALLRLTEDDPEAADLAEQIAANASGILKGLRSGGPEAEAWINALLELVSSDSDQQAAAALPILEAAAEQPRLVPTVLERYLRLGFYKRAGKLFEKHWSLFNLSRPTTQLRFDPAFLAMTESIQDEEIRILGELYVGMLYPPTPTAEKPRTLEMSGARNLRIEELARQFQKRKFGEERIRNKAFGALIAHSTGRKVLESNIQSEMMDDIEEVIAIRSDADFTRQWKLWKLKLEEMIEEGQIAEFVDLIPDPEWFRIKKPMRPGTVRNQPSREEQVWLGFFDALEDNLSSVPGEQLDQMGEVLDKLAVIPIYTTVFGSPERLSRTETAGFVTFSSVQLYVGMRLAFEVARGIEKPGDGWLESLPKKATDPGSRRFNMHVIAISYLRAARHFSPAIKDAGVKKRREAVAKFIKTPLPVPLFGPEYQRSFLLDFTGWFTRDEVLAFGPEEAEADPRGGHAFADLASVARPRDKQLAYRMMKRAIEMKILDEKPRTWPVSGYERIWEDLQDWKRSDTDSPEEKKEK